MILLSIIKFSSKKIESKKSESKKIESKKIESKNITELNIIRYIIYFIIKIIWVNLQNLLTINYHKWMYL